MPTLLALAWILLARAAAPAPAVPISLALHAEKLTVAGEASLPAFATLELSPRGDGRYGAKLLPADPHVALPDLDLRLLAPRVPRLAQGNPPLTRLALLQREFNRNETHYDLGGGLDFSIANNCLREGLWEVKLARKEPSRTVLLYHAWTDFPPAEYARLFQEVNGVPIGENEKLFTSYPGLGGFAVPLGELRQVLGETPLAPIETHAGDPLQRLTEQQGKTKLILSPDIATYGDFSAAARQPVALAKFVDPGRYDSGDPMRFDLSWLASPAQMTWRSVRGPKGGTPFPEVEVRFANGNRIVLADSRLADLPARTSVPATESEVLKLVCGIGTPDIQASAPDRERELSEDRPRYLMLLDAQGRHLDNHFAGVDGVYAWREAGEPGRLHLWLVSYERIAFVAHLSAPWPAGATGSSIRR